MMETTKQLSQEQIEELLKTLRTRFEKNLKRHRGLEWAAIQDKLKANPEKLWSLDQMEATGGEPDVIGQDKETSEYIFCDCSAETPKSRRSICYDPEGQQMREKEGIHPNGSALGMANAMGIDILDEEQYRQLQTLGNFDTKTSSWIKAPTDIRKLGGAIFGDYRYGHTFVYHNSAHSFYGSRAFRGLLKV